MFLLMDLLLLLELMREKLKKVCNFFFFFFFGGFFLVSGTDYSLLMLEKMNKREREREDNN